MSFNGSGVFNINTAGQPVVTGTTISSTTFNNLTADLATGLTTALTKDGQSTPTANIGMGAFKITNLAAGTVASDAARLDQVQGGAATFISVTGTDSLTGTVVPALSAYATGNQFSFLVANTNTGAVTINVDGIGSKAITRTGTTALVAGDMVAGQAVEIIYDGTRFQLVNGNSFTNLKVSGTLGVTGVATFTAQPIVSSLTASLPVFTDASKGLVSNTMTGTGDVVMSTNAVLTTPALGTPSALVGTNITGTAAGLTAGTVTTNANLTGPITSVGNATSIASQTGTGTTFAMSASPTFTGTVGAAALTTTGNTILGDASTDTLNVGNGGLVKDASGNVGIGTASPAFSLDVRGDGQKARFGNTTVGCTVGNYVGGTIWGCANNAGSSGMFGDVSNYIYFASNGAERMRIDSSGNVGIGVTPSAWSSDYKALQIGQSAFMSRTAGSDNYIFSNSYFNGSLFKYINTAAAAYYAQDAGAHKWYNAASGTAGDAITFTQAMTLDASGNLLVGTTSGATGAKLSVVQTTSNVITANIQNTASINAYCLDLQTSGQAAGSVPTFLRGFASGPTQTLNIANNGNITNTNNSYGPISDVKLKENIVDATPKLDKLLQVRIVNYNLKADLGYESHKQLGVIAQELEQVFPSLVDESPDRDKEGNDLGTTTKSVKMSVFVPMLIKAIQEQQALIIQLQADVATLKALSA